MDGENRKINLYTLDDASRTSEVFWEKALKKGAISPSANVVVSNGAMKSAVAQEPCRVGKSTFLLTHEICSGNTSRRPGCVARR